MTEKMEICSVGKSVVDQKKGDFMQKELLSPVECLEDETGNSEMPKVDNNEVYFDIVDKQSFEETHDEKTDEKVNIVTEANTKTAGCNCSRQLLKYESKIKSLEEQLNLPSYSKILTNDKSCNYFTNFEKFELLHKFHDVVAPLVRRRSQPVSQTQTKRQFITTSKKWEKKGNYIQKTNFC